VLREALLLEEVGLKALLDHTRAAVLGVRAQDIDRAKEPSICKVMSVERQLQEKLNLTII
jgi:hypothetical protein